MADAQEVKDYLAKLPSYRTDLYTALDEPDKDKAIFSAEENLNDYFGSDKVTAKAVALQLLYEVESESEEYAKLRRQGVTDAKYDDVSVKLTTDLISPQVMTLIGALKSNGKTARIV